MNGLFLPPFCDGVIASHVLDVLRSDIFQVLEPFDPVLAGTFPIGLDLPYSDLDILCAFDDRTVFIELLTQTFQHLPGWRLKQSMFQGHASVVAGFSVEKVPVEIFGQTHTVWFQNAYRHMVVEYRLLALGGEHLKHQVLNLKTVGLSTEEAFAGVLELEGCPYQTLYDLSFLTCEELALRFEQFTANE